jgi:polar amino acid transport system substrate-binding protein
MTRSRLWLALMLAALLAIGSVAAGCGGDDDNDEPTVETDQLELITDGTLLVGSDIPYPPFEFGDPPDYEGFDIDIVNEIADRLELELEIQDTPFETIFRDLQQGRFDLVASATTITPEREQQVTFSEPYYRSDQSLLVKEGTDIETVDDLGGRTIGAEAGTTGLDYAREQTDADTVRRFPGITQAFNALQAEQIEAVINDLPVSQEAEETFDDLVVVETLATDEFYGLAMQQEATNLQQAVNEALQEMFDDGTYADFYREWFDEDPPEEFGGEPDDE